MPQNPLEIDLALRAAKVAWEKYPYLEYRYGERGRRFTDSDSCWLVTLTRAPRQVAVTKALEWLRTVLASRGIPTVILEFHLDAILRRSAWNFLNSATCKPSSIHSYQTATVSAEGCLALIAGRA